MLVLPDDVIVETYALETCSLAACKVMPRTFCVLEFLRPLKNHLWVLLTVVELGFVTKHKKLNEIIIIGSNMNGARDCHYTTVASSAPGHRVGERRA